MTTTLSPHRDRLEISAPAVEIVLAQQEIGFPGFGVAR
jgi:hypothetical protein